MSDLVALIARVCLAVLFLVAGFGKLTAVAGIAGMLQRRGFPAPTAFGYAVGAIELLGGILLVAGWKARYVALVLCAFTAGTVIMAHNFWDMQGAERASNQTHALKNLAIMGGFLLLAAFGPGRYSVDRR